ncbi:MAG: flagellar biosynthetic protein FliR [Deltaproteobacteria bacterium]|nr:flagellar biosynthetic protein FliR [Deltaproteobacteria bacterium]
MERLFQLAGITIDWRFALVVASLIFIRLMMITATIPFLTGKPVPAMVKVGLAASLVVFLYPYVSSSIPQKVEIPPILMMLLYFKEAFYGIAIGFTASIVFHGFQAAGLVIDNQRGAAQARLLIPQFGQESSVFGQFEYLLGIVLFLVIGGHLLFFKVVVESYDLLPILSLPKSQLDLVQLVDEFIHITGAVLVLSVQLCAPVLIAIFIADVILGMISKTAPSINVWELGFVVRGVLGVFIVFLALGLIASQMEKISIGMITFMQKSTVEFLPDYLNPILMKNRIGCDDRQVFNTGLRDQQAIEGVFVVEGEVGNGKRMFLCYRE